MTVVLERQRKVLALMRDGRFHFADDVTMECKVHENVLSELKEKGLIEFAGARWWRITADGIDAVRTPGEKR